MITTFFRTFLPNFGSKHSGCLWDRHIRFRFAKEGNEKKHVCVKTYHLNGDGMKFIFSLKDPNDFELIYEDKQRQDKVTRQSIYRE